MSQRIAVFGASGFIGATLVEHLLEMGGAQVVPIIHSTGNAWRLARRGLDLHSVDVVDAEAVRSVVRDCSHVVNCALGSKRARTTGLRNILRASREAGVGRFVHLSTVSVYGQQPLEQDVVEEARPAPLKGYGTSKLEQDRLIASAHREGLSCALIAPPNITGAYSAFLLKVIGAMRRGQLALIDEGKLPCSLVDVHDVARAIVRALHAEQADGTRIFATNDAPDTWRDLVEVLRPFAEGAPEPPSYSREEALALVGSGGDRASPLRTAKTVLGCLTSPASRQVLRRDPFAQLVYQGIAERLPASAEERLRGLGGRSQAVPAAPPSPYLDLLDVQLRARRYSCEKAKRVLGYRPRYDLRGSVAVFEAWYRATIGWGSPEWEMVNQL